MKVKHDMTSNHLLSSDIPVENILKVNANFSCIFLLFDNYFWFQVLMKKRSIKENIYFLYLILLYKKIKFKYN